MAGHRKNLECKVSAVIHDLGIPAHIKGYGYLREAVVLRLEGKKCERGVYPEIAESNRTTVRGVERAIRHAIEVTWQRRDNEVRRRYFEYAAADFEHEPSDTDFISAIAVKIAESGCKTAR